MNKLNNLENIDDNKWDRVLRPKRNILDIDLKEIWEHRDLLYMFVRRDFITVYKQTILGPIWFFIQPLMVMFTYIIIFNNIARIPTDNVPPSIFYLSGIVVWNYFTHCFNTTANTFIENANIYGKVYFPRLIIPISKVIIGLLSFMIQMILLFIVLIYLYVNGSNVNSNWQILLTPYYLILMAGLGLGAGLLITSVTAKYRDFRFLISFGVQLLMYATPIIYPMSIVPKAYRVFIIWNPIAYIIEGFKFAFLGAGHLSVWGLLYATAFMVILLILGIIFFNRTEQNFMDSI